MLENSTARMSSVQGRYMLEEISLALTLYDQLNVNNTPIEPLFYLIRYSIYGSLSLHLCILQTIHGVQVHLLPRFFSFMWSPLHPVIEYIRF